PLVLADYLHLRPIDFLAQDGHLEHVGRVCSRRPRRHPVDSSLDYLDTQVRFGEPALEHFEAAHLRLLGGPIRSALFLVGITPAQLDGTSMGNLLSSRMGAAFTLFQVPTSSPWGTCNEINALN